MSLYFSLRDLTGGLPKIGEQTKSSLEPALLNLFQMRAGLPISLKSIEGLRVDCVADRATPEKIARLVESDPFLALRLVALVNQTFYHRGHDIVTVQGAVSHLGVWKVPEVCADLGDAKSFKAIYLGRSTASFALQELVFCAALAKRIANLMAPREGIDQIAYLLAVLGRIGAVLLAYARPNIYCACFFDAFLSETSSFDRSFKKLLGKTIPEFGVELGRALALPKRILNSTSLLHIAPWHKRVWAADEGREVRIAIGSVHVAYRIASTVTEMKGQSEIDALVEDMASRINLKTDVLREAVGESLAAMIESLNRIGLTALRLPPYVERFTEPIVERDGTINTRNIKWPGIAERMNSFLNELRACFKTRAQGDEFYYLPQAVHCTLRALIHGLNFDFAMFMRYSVAGDSLTPYVWLGEEPDGVRELVRSRGKQSGEYMPDVQALLQKKAVFTGDPITPDHWPFAAFPAIARNDVLGVFYAHKHPVSEANALETQEQVAVIALAEEWHDVPSGFY
ncbi:MAG: HDOD domain-containing protein [Oligoflexia bacterium]|nr:HDOD domain-containing protein [Oligoflexia bacterium]